MRRTPSTTSGCGDWSAGSSSGMIRIGRSVSRAFAALAEAGAFHRRHQRAGHLFQNRDTSVLVEEAPYLLELVRYLRLNPLRAQVVPDLRTLERGPWTDHSALLGTVPRPWQATPAVLGHFGPRRRAWRAYRAFVADGIPRGRRPDLHGGGPLRSLGGWAVVQRLRRAREAYRGDERVLGSRAFVEALRRTGEAAEAPRSPRRALEPLAGRVCRQVGLPREAAGGGAAGSPSTRPAPPSPISGSRSSAIPAGPWSPSSACSPRPFPRPPGGARCKRPCGGGSWRRPRRSVRMERPLFRAAPTKATMRAKCSLGIDGT